jgi:hypothetical protein
MEKKMLILTVVTFTIFLSGCIQSDVGKMNDMAISINNHLKRGDNYYNLSASDTNKELYSQALSECNNASYEYGLAQNTAKEAYNSAKNSQDPTYIDYMQNVLFELEAKLNATSELKNSIELLQKNQTSQANNRMAQANSYMEKALEYQKNREQIVDQNPSKFKAS